MLEGADHPTTTMRWETEACPRCKARTTFWLVAERVSRCSQCHYEIDRSRGLGLDPADHGGEPKPN